jgi:hypothetical protein
MAVPKAAVDKDHDIPFRQHQVRATRQILSMKTEAKPQAMQQAPDNQLRAGVHAADRPHDLRPPHLCKNVHIYFT